MRRRVLVVEDDADIRALLALHLDDLGCEVVEAASGEAALGRLDGERLDLVLLDLRLPGIDGLELCRRIRAAPRYTPILMLTARAAEADRVVGLEAGADDYLTKPFGIAELLARVRAIFRRVDALSETAVAGRILERGELHIDAARREVRLAGRPISLTAREFDLLHHLARRPGQVFSRRQLLDQVWGERTDAYEHTVSSHVNRLRRKIEVDPVRPARILTVWGVGYKLAGGG